MANKTKPSKTAVPAMYRQGDVLIVRVDGIPSNMKKLNPKHPVTLAFGEVTGHSHQIHKGATAFAAEVKDDNVVSLAEYIEVEEQLAALTHQEHDTINLPAGTYKIGHQREYTPEALRNVAD